MNQFEYGLKTVLVTMADLGLGGFDLNEMISIIEDEKKKTLGQVVNLLHQRVKLSEGWTNSLATGLDARNRFVHRFLSEVDDRLADPSTRAGVIAEVKAIRKVILEADRAVQQILETLYEHAGLNWQQLRSRWAEDIRALNMPVTSEARKADGAANTRCTRRRRGAGEPGTVDGQDASVNVCVEDAGAADVTATV